MYIKIKKLNEKAIVPTMSYGTSEAGLDFYSIEEKSIFPNSKEVISTGISVELPETVYLDLKSSGACCQTGSHFKFYLKLYSRSGMSAKTGIECGAGVIDASYRGEVKVVLFNHSNKVFTVREGDKIVQGVLYMIPCYEIEVCDTLSETNRGSLGFGSSDRQGNKS